MSEALRYLLRKLARQERDTHAEWREINADRVMSEKREVEAAVLNSFKVEHLTDKTGIVLTLYQDDAIEIATVVMHPDAAGLLADELLRVMGLAREP